MYNFVKGGWYKNYDLKFLYNCRGRGNILRLELKIKMHLISRAANKDRNRIAISKLEKLIEIKKKRCKERTNFIKLDRQLS